MELFDVMTKALSNNIPEYKGIMTEHKINVHINNFIKHLGNFMGHFLNSTSWSDQEIRPYDAHELSERLKKMAAMLDRFEDSPAHRNV
jgi:hypothetical protein